MDAQHAHGRSWTLIFEDAHGRSFLQGRSWTLFLRTLISDGRSWTLMDARTLMERSDAHGRSWTLIFGCARVMDAHGRFSDAGRTQAGRWSDVLGRLRTFGKYGHATVTVTLQNHKKYCRFFEFYLSSQQFL
jgi:hypothetical protein